ncbi:HAD hydrolase family protein [Endozoicomonas sp. SM1973]|uniref:3-deoxy-D-manno-octulosonate 8-phosphate phosphatase KdsC n=1 Tax=Spartinivicinus marinus TaxID=2994442 RepID=A0A853I4T9_9GAMM|nr:HAD hydrolase family protein [Spartinivicinus marinus]MCX4025725.1 HAD hydrolase family protein [Spartinivicinus marinus]NYZ65718.1 HAD hydrolase family protein [Spartinivicinus marinus]
MNLDPQLIVKAQAIKLLGLDVDGVMTDGRLYFTADGQEFKTFNILDGHGIKMLQSTGVKVAIITGRETTVVAKRAKDLGIELLLQGREDKRVALNEIRQQLQLDWNEIAYLGDDLPDLPAIQQVGLGLSVPNGYWLVKQHADGVTQTLGGAGAVREVCDFIMSAQNTLQPALTPYMQASE